MSNHFLEGESYFVLKELARITDGKIIDIDPTPTSSFSLLHQANYNVFIDPAKETLEKIDNNFIVCFLDKNVDQRLEYIKKIKQKCDFSTFEPIPTTDFTSLQKIFPQFKQSNNFLPHKNCSLKYKGQKQNYEWFDLCLIDNLRVFNDTSIFQILFDSYFDIWRFTDELWAGDSNCISQIKHINEKNFEEYFNKIRETSKDYLDVIQTNASNFYIHRQLMPNTIITNEFRFDKIKQKLCQLKPNTSIYTISFIDECLKNVRDGSNPKLELIKLFFRFKKNVL